MGTTNIQRYKLALERLRKLSDIRLSKPLLIQTATGELRVLHINDIGYFHYISTGKYWEVALTDGSSIRLRSRLCAGNLCAYNQNFVQIHQSYIVNLRFLHLIQDKKCMLSFPFHAVKGLQVSQKYRKELMLRFDQF